MAKRRSSRSAIAVAAGVALALLVVQGDGYRSTAVRAAETQHAALVAKAMLNWYYLPDDGLMARYAEPLGGGAVTADLWGYSWALAGLEDVAALPGGERFLPLMRLLADNLEAYWDGDAKLPGYAPTVYPGQDALKYYDDNAWAGLDLVAAFEMTGDGAYLARAERVFRYLESGWDPAGGGIYWNEAHLTRNTASTAPTAELAAWLYMATHQKLYLSWAERLFAWESRHLVNRSTGQVYGSIDADRNISSTDWTYNQGSVIGAAVRLYRATHRASYLKAAQRTAAFVRARLVRADGTLMPPAEFGGVLADDLRLLYDETHDPGIARLVAASAQAAWTRARNPQDLIGDDWQGPPPTTAGLALLTQTGAVRLFAVDAAVKSSVSGPLALLHRPPVTPAG